MLLHQLVDSVAAAHPERTALFYRGEAISFAELSDRSRGAARAIGTITEPGDRVAIVGENHPSWIECYYGVPRAGRVLVFLNHRLAPAELASTSVDPGHRCSSVPVASSIASHPWPPSTPMSIPVSTLAAGPHW